MDFGSALRNAGVNAEIAAHYAPVLAAELPAFAKAIQPFTADLAIEPDWLRLLGSHGEAMIDAMAIASRQSVP